MSYALVNGLRARGLDVLSALEADMLGATDDEQLALATASERSIFTYNVADFCRLHSAYLSTRNRHAGIIVCNRLTLSLGQQIRKLVGLASLFTQDQMQNRLEFL
jgi:hypothetical protein